MKIFEHRITVQASPERIFEIYRDVERWKEWDSEVEWSTIKGSFVAGSVGKLKPPKGPISPIKIVDVRENESFTVESKLPLCLLKFEHEITVQDSIETSVTHRVIFTGPLHGLFANIIGKQIDAGLPKTMRGLKLKAEEGV